MTKIVEAISHM